MNESTGKKRDQISLKLSKDLSNELWSVKKTEGKAGGTTNKRKTNIEAASAPNKKNSCKVSIPMERLVSAMRNRKDPAFKIPDLIRIENPRPPPPSPPSLQLMRPPAPVNTTSLRMVRHPVPTGKVRTVVADKLEKIVKNSSTKEPVQNNVAESRITPATIHSPYSRGTEVFSAKHKLPVVIPSSNNNSVISNPVYKESHLNDCCTVPRTISTAVAASQTERIVTATEQYSRPLQRVNLKIFIDSDLEILTLTISTTDAATQTERVFIFIEQDFRTLQRVKTNNIIESDIQILPRTKSTAVAASQAEIMTIDTEQDFITLQRAKTKNIIESDVQILPRTISTAVAASQTESIYIVTEQDFKILQTVKTKNIIESDIQILDALKDSGVTKQQLQKELDKIKKRREFNNDSECIVIDVESDSEKPSDHDNNTLSKVIRHSEQNKKYLLSLSKLFPLPKGRSAAASAQPILQPGTVSAKTVAFDVLPRFISAAPTGAVEPIVRPGTYPKDCNQIATTKTPNTFSSFGNIVECDNISNSPTTRTLTRIARDKMLSDLDIAPTAIQTPRPGIVAVNPPVLRNSLIMTAMEKNQITSDNVEPTLISSENLNTQPEDENNNTMDRDNLRDDVIPIREHNNLQHPLTVTARPVVQEQQQNEPPPQPQDLPYFQHRRNPVQIQHPQTQPYVAPGHHVRPRHYFPPRSRKIQQQRKQYADMRPQFPYPHEQNRHAVTTPHIRPRIPPVQQHHNGPRQFLPEKMSIGGSSRLLRVLSTDEANLHGLAAQHGSNFNFPVYYDRFGNRWPSSLPDYRHFY